MFLSTKLQNSRSKHNTYIRSNNITVGVHTLQHSLTLPVFTHKRYKKTTNVYVYVKMFMELLNLFIVCIIKANTNYCDLNNDSRLYIVSHYG